MALTHSNMFVGRFATSISAALSALLLVFASVQARAQTVKPFDELFPQLQRKQLFVKYSTQDGLSSSTCRKLFMDRRGFLWIGTADGLNRFDGKKFEVFVNNPLDSNSLSANVVMDILEDKNSTLWIAIWSGGLNEYDRGTNRIYKYWYSATDSTSISENNARYLYRDRTGTLWIGTYSGGLNKLIPPNGVNSPSRGRAKFARYVHDPNDPTSLSGGRVLAIREDTAGIIWVTTDEGVNRFNRASGRFTRFKTDPRLPQSLHDKVVTHIDADRSGSLWISTTDGLYEYNPTSTKIRTYRCDSTDIHTLTTNRIDQVYEDTRGVIWVITQSGLNQLDRRTGSIIQYKEPEIDNRINDVIEDPAGNLWVSAEFSGLHAISSRAREFKSFTYPESKVAVLEDYQHSIWIQTRDSLLRFGVDNSITNLPGLKKAYRKTGICEIRDSVAWCGTMNSGLAEFNLRTGKIAFHKRAPVNTPMDNSSIPAVSINKAGHLWVGTDEFGLCTFDPYVRKYVSEYKNIPNDSTSLSHNSIWCIYVDREGIVWIGTVGGGLNRFDPANQKFRHWQHNPSDSSSISYDAIYSMSEDETGSLWVGTAFGLNQFDKTTGKFRRFYRSEPKASNSVRGTVADKNGDIWIRYEDGVCKLQKSTGMLTSYSSKDGLPDGPFAYESALWSLPNGEIVLPLWYVVAFDPDSIRPSSFIPNIVLTSFSVFEKSLSLSEDTIGYRTITMPYDSNFFAFEFASLDLTVPERNQHAYKLEGYEDNWNYVGNEREAHYTKVPPGEYVFRVKGTNSDGVWSTKEASINIIITPPWWKTKLAYAFYGIFFVSVLYSLREFEKKRERMKQQAELERLESEKRLQQEFSKQLIETQEAERKRVASELHDSLGQQLLIVNNELQLSLQSKQFVESDVQRTVSVVKDAIKEVREIASNLHPHHLEKLGLRAAVEAMIEQLSRSTTVQFDTAIEDVDSRLSMEAKINLYRVLQESVANIVRHSGATHATITISHSDNAVQTIIEDNGRGFTQGASHGGRQGFGLKSMAERMSMIGGTITFDSSSGKGTTIHITIPTHN